MSQLNLKSKWFIERKNMGALIFIVIWHFGQPVFVKRGLNNQQRFLVSAAVGILFETAIFVTTNASMRGHI